LNENIILKINLIPVGATKTNSKKSLLPFERHEKLITVRATSKTFLGKAYYRFNDNKNSKKITTTKDLGKDSYRSNDNKSSRKSLLPFELKNSPKSSITL
jgi:hypothetical protein